MLIIGAKGFAKELLEKIKTLGFDTQKLIWTIQE